MTDPEDAGLASLFTVTAVWAEIMAAWTELLRSVKSKSCSSSPNRAGFVLVFRGPALRVAYGELGMSRHLVTSQVAESQSCIALVQ